MRDQFYGDRKDVLKWTLALQAAGEEKDILYVAMYRPNEGLHGKDFRPIDQAIPQVVRFFDTAREKFVNGQHRRCVDVVALLPGRIDLVPEIYEHRARREYFDRVRGRLGKASSGKNAVVLLDPDNGIAGVSANSKHVCPEQIEDVWPAMRPGDVLLVYQHQFRDKEWRSKRRTALSSALGLSQERIRDRCASDVRDVCFFEVTKSADDQYQSCD